MKMIIASTDFSAASVNACEYAAHLALKLKCKLTLFNIFDAPIVHSNAGLYGYSYSSIKKVSQTKIDSFMALLNKKFPLLKISTFVSGYDFKSELQNFITQHQVMAVVMGLDTKNKISKYIFGSHGVNIAGKIDAPVIIVPQKFTKHTLQNAVLAVDNSEKLLKSSLKEIEKIIKTANLTVQLLYVRTPDELLNEKFTSLKLNGKNYIVNTIRAKDIQSGLKRFVKEHAIDITFIVSKNHSVLYNFFVESNTKKIAFATDVPVMAVHEG